MARLSRQSRNHATSTSERFGQDRPRRLRPRPRRPRLRAGVDRRHRAGRLPAAGLPVTNVSDVTGFPEMMDGRVKTLHPLIHGGILARRDQPDDLDAARAHGIGLIDLVVVNLYPFGKAAANPDDAVRRAGRGDRHRRAEPGARRRQELPRRARRGVARPTTRGCSTRWTRPAGPTLPFRFELARKAFAHTAAYDGAIAGDARDDHVRRGLTPRARRRPARRRLAARAEPAASVRDLRYGENPHQPAALVRRCRPTGSARPRCSRARSCRTRTCSTSTRPRASRSSSPSRRRSSSSTRTRAARRPARRSPRPTCARARPIRWRRSAASSG